MTDTEVAIAAITLAGTSIGGVMWVVKYLANTLSRDLREHTEAATRLSNAAQEQTKASKEVLIFMQNLNGKLAKATIKAAKEHAKE